MTIGTGVVLFVIGAILTFALNIDVGWADLDMVGYILMGAGVVAFIVGLVLLARRRRTDVVTRTEPAVGGYETRRSTRTAGDEEVF
ncbi:DUF6458 family protein [Microbacterium sp. NPDC089321]|uniref:DUF6458 family protein n=1 Tax=Microbacterium sp. NPDC089321 TaxID=3155183 RepID=UPI00341F53B3